MGNFSIDNSKRKVSDINKNIESKQSELKQLEKNKKELLDAATDIQGANVDKKTKRLVMEKINSGLEDNSEKGKELSEEMKDDFKNIESIRQDATDSAQSNLEQRKGLEKKKELLDKVGLGKHIDSAINELDENKTQIDELQKSLQEAEKKATSISSKLSSL